MIIERMLGNVLAVVPDAIEETTTSGLHLVGPKQGQYSRGKIISVGTGMPGYPLHDFVAGDFVTYLSVTGDPITLYGQPCVCVNIQNVIKIETYDDNLE